MIVHGEVIGDSRKDLPWAVSTVNNRPAAARM